MSTIAFVTHSGAPYLTDDDQLTARVLQDTYGLRVEPLPWDDPALDPTEFDLLVLRSTWNYYRKYEEFKGWLQNLDNNNIPVMNPVPLVLWNSNKYYLSELQEQGFPVAETRWLPKGSTVDLQALIREMGYQQAILKPTVSAGAWHTWRIPAGEARDYQPTADEILSVTDAMLQPFYDEIIETGEYSLTFLGRNYSHTTLKKPKNGDYRVQREHGGTYVAADPNKEWIDLGYSLIASLPHQPLYTRMDGVSHDGEFKIIEVELIEPDLYTRFAGHAPEMFAAAIADALNKQ